VLLAVSVATGAEVVSRIVMRVNDEVATLFDYQQRKAEMEQAILTRENLTLQQRRDAISQLGERVFRQMFEELLLLSRADQIGVSVSDEELDEEIARVREGLGLDTQEQFEAALEQSGMTVDQLRAQTRRNLLSQKVLGREVYAKIEVDDEILRRYYRDHPEQFTVPERLQLRELVVLDDSSLAEEERRELAVALRQELLAGREIAELADEYSADGRTSGLIELGWVSPGDLSPEIEESVWELEVGAVSEPVAARGGDHLLQVMTREEPFLRPFSEVAEAIRLRERQRRSIDELQSYLDRLENQAFVRVDPPPEAEGFRRATLPDRGPGLELTDGGSPADDGGDAAPSADPTPATPPAPATDGR